MLKNKSLSFSRKIYNHFGLKFMWLINIKTFVFGAASILLSKPRKIKKS